MDTILKYVADKPVYPVDNRGFYHHIMSLIISQRVRITVSQKIRANIYKLLGKSDLCDVMTLTERDRTAVGLSDQKWQIMRDFDQQYQSCHGGILAINGIGPWTLACAKIMAGDYSCGFIYGDLAVRKKIADLLGRNITEKELRLIFNSVDANTGGRIFSQLWYDTLPKTRSP